MIKKIVFALIICSGVSILTDAGAILYAQKIDRSDISVFGRNHFGRILQVSDERLNDWYMAYDVAVGFDTDPSDSCQFAQTYGYPVLGVGISVSQLSKMAFALPSFYTDLYTVYGSFDRTLVNRDKWRWGYMLEAGITTNPGSYDPLENPYNRLQSSPVMAYFGAGFFWEYLLGKHWSAGIEAMYRHQSNGRLSLPNSGIDVVGVGAYARYHIKENRHPEISYPSSYEYERGFQWHIYAGGGYHSCNTEWKAYNEMVEDPSLKRVSFDKHPIISIGADCLYRYHLKYATGIGVDLNYLSNMKSLKECDRIIYGEEAATTAEYSSISVGIGLVHEFFWRNLAGHLTVGAYPYLKTGLGKDIQWNYQKAGLRYYFPKANDMFVGFVIKASSFVADHFELSVGLRMQHKSVR